MSQALTLQAAGSGSGRLLSASGPSDSWLMVGLGSAAGDRLYVLVQEGT